MTTPDARIDRMEALIDQMNIRLTSVEAIMEQINIRLGTIEARFSDVDARFAQIDTRFSQIDARFAQVDARIDGLRSEINSRFNTLTTLMFASVASTILTAVGLVAVILVTR